MKDTYTYLATAHLFRLFCPYVSVAQVADGAGHGPFYVFDFRFGSKTVDFRLGKWRISVNIHIGARDFIGRRVPHHGASFTFRPR